MAEPALPDLVDIIAPWVPPAAPPPYAWIALIVGLGCVAALSLARFLWRRGKNRRAALAQLKQAERALQHQKLEPRAAAFQVAQALRRAHSKSSSTDNTLSWVAFLSTLDQARYAPHAPSAHDAAQLIAQARHWINRTC